MIAKVNEAVVLALADPDVRQKLADHGFEIPSREELSPEALGAYQQAEIRRWWPIIREANIKAD